jgi:hypothetical protein
MTPGKQKLGWSGVSGSPENLPNLPVPSPSTDVAAML